MAAAYACTHASNFTAGGPIAAMQCSACVCLLAMTRLNTLYQPQINYLGRNVPLLLDMLTSC